MVAKWNSLPEAVKTPQSPVPGSEAVSQLQREISIPGSLKTRIAIALALLVLIATACAEPPTPHAPVLLRLSGSTSMQLLLRDLAAAYSERHRYVTFEFSAVGSTAGIEVLRRGDADLALVSRELQPEE